MKLLKIHEQVLCLLSSESISIYDKDRAEASLIECVAKSRCLFAYNEMLQEINKSFSVVPMLINGVKMYAVQSGQYTEKYCDDVGRAVKLCNQLNGFNHE